MRTNIPVNEGEDMLVNKTYKFLIRLNQKNKDVEKLALRDRNGPKCNT